VKLPLLLKAFPFILLTGIIFLVSSSYSSQLERKGLNPAGNIVFVSGKVVVRLVPWENYFPAVPGQELVAGDIIKTGPGGRVSILFRDDTQLKLASNTTLIIREVTSHKERAGAMKILLSLESGEVWTRSKGLTDGLLIETPYATAAIRGTEWSLSVKDNESRIVVMEGNVQLSNTSGSITVGKNEQAVVIGRQAPVKSIIIRPRDRIQWTYYLPERRLLGYLKFREGISGKAETLFNEGRLEESAKVFEETLLREPENPFALTGLGLIELKKGDVEKSREYLDKSLKIQKNLLAFLGLSYILIMENMTEEARDILNNTKESFFSSPLPYIFSSYLYTFHGDFKEALNECDRGLSIIPNEPLLLSFKVDIYFILDRPEEAKVMIDTLLKENLKSSVGYERLGLYYRVITGDSKRAKEAFKRSIDLDRFNDDAIAKLADLLREEGYIPEALKLIKDAISIAPWNAMHHYTYGRLLADTNRIDEARNEFRKSLELDPSFSRAYLGEGIVLLKEGRTDEALKELSKASLFDPNFSEIHDFLAIAYYQKHDVNAALDELKRAEECDPVDSTPHQLASTIYTDIYMPLKAIEEAQKVIDLLPYRKASGEALLESAQKGTMSVNYGLDFFDLPEWSLYYAQKALFIHPYSNTSHTGVAIAYDKLGLISALQGYNEFATPYFSEILQGSILNVNSLNFSNRYSTLISKPGHYLTLGSTYARGDSEEKQVDLIANGDFGSRFPLTYRFNSKAYRDNGYLENSRFKSVDAEVVFGYKPDYKDDIYLDLGYYKDKVRVTPFASEWDDNQRYKDKGYWIELGYHRRFSPVSHLITGFRYFRDHDNLENPDFTQDLSGFANSSCKLHNIALGIRHMFTPFEDHQVSYGIDYNFEKLHYDEEWTERIQESYRTRSFIFHIYDRWAITPKITLDAGLFFSYYSPEGEYHSQDTLSVSIDEILFNENKFNLNPRVGLAIDLGKKGIFRLAYQSRSTTGFLGELSPVGTSGLIPPSFDIDFNEAHDLQGSIEYELTKKTFIKTLIGYERLSDLTTTGSDKKAQLWYSRIAINRILNNRLSFSARYHYNDSMYLDGSGRKLQGIPQNSGDARLVFIHPEQIYLWIRESYIGDRFADHANAIKLKGYLVTDFYVRKESLKKQLSLSFAIHNIFNAKYKTLSHPYYWFDGALPARGTTFSLRIEYRL